MNATKRPLIGITADLVGDYARNRRTYLDMVAAAGGIPVILPPNAVLCEEMLDRVDGVIITGGDDIDVSKFGIEAIHNYSDGPAKWAERIDSWSKAGATHFCVRTMGETPVGPATQIEALRKYAEAVGLKG